MRTKKAIMETGKYLFLILVVLIFLFPVMWVLMTSLKQPVDAFSMPPKWVFTPTLEFHKFIWSEKNFPTYLINSLIISGGTVLLSVTLAALAGYGYSRYKSRLTDGALFGLLAIRMFPRMLLVIPFFILARILGLYDTHIVMILICVAFNQPFSVWLMKNFFDEIPTELDEAATIDGCSKMQTLYYVLLPIALPGLVTVTIFGFLLAYNEYLFPLVLTGTVARPLTVAIAEYGGEDIKYWSISAAGTIGIIAPVVIIMIFLRKHFVKGLMTGALKR